MVQGEVQDVVYGQGQSIGQNGLFELREVVSGCRVELLGLTMFPAATCGSCLPED